MPIYVFWGEDDFAMSQAIAGLRQKVLDPNWIQFNFERIVGDRPEAMVEGLNQAMTPPFGMGGRLIWIEEAIVTQSCSEKLLEELQRTLPKVPQSSTLLLTTRKKLDKRGKSVKLLQKHAEIREFSFIPPWKTEEIIKNVRQFAREKEVKLTPRGIELLAESVGNNTRQLWNELDKLRLYGEKTKKPLDETVIARLVAVNTQNSLQLAKAIREGNESKALGLVADLIHRNEPALRIVATLVGQFRTWLMVKLMIESGEKDERAIASAADIGNPKRIYFIRKEIQSVSSQQLLKTLPILLELEVNLKRGADPIAILQSKAIELCRACKSHSK
ncbi:MAG: DNA polymerase III subunit delta [Cyanobacteria bacterium SBLK]|nr:DNA polymerase III subunit delta [Cyanobacteria bacterium SBLK]